MIAGWLKSGRIAQQLTVRQVSELLDIDGALISRFENGQRRPTRRQLLDLCRVYELDADALLSDWLKSKILDVVKDEPMAEKALRSALSDISPDAVLPDVQKLLSEMENLKAFLGKQP